MNETISLYKNPFPAILRLAKNVDIGLLKSGDLMYDIISQISFPFYDDDVINGLTDTFEYPNYVTQSILKLNYSYPYIHEVTLAVIKTDLSKNEVIATSLFLSFISWYNYYILTHDKEYAIPILRALASDTALLFPSIAVSSFFFLYKALIQNSEICKHDLIQVLMYFFSLPLQYPSGVTSMLALTLSSCITAGSTIIDDAADFALKVVQLVADTHQGLLSGIYADDLIAKISVNVSRLDPLVIPYFSILLKCATPNNHTLLFDMISDNFISTVRKDNDWPTPAEARILEDDGVTTFSFNFSDVKTFKNGFDWKKVVDFPKVGALKDLLSEETEKKLELILPLLKNNPIYIPHFLSSLLEKIKSIEPSYDAFAALIISISELRSLDPKSSYGLELYNTELYNPGITIFCTDDFEKINTLRSNAFDIMLEEGSLTLAHIFQKVQREPWQCAELFARCQNQMHAFTGLVVNSNIFLKSIRDIFIFLRCANINEPNPTDIELARERLYALFLTLLYKQGPRILIFKEPIFVQAFMLGFFEEELLPETRSVIQFYLIDDVPHDLIFDTLIQSIINSQFDGTNSDRYLKLIIDVVQLVTNIIPMKWQIIRDLSSFNKGLILSISKIPSDNKLSELLLKNIINYFTVIANYINLDEDICKALPKVFSNAFGNDIPGYFIPYFRHFMASSPYGIEGELFVVTQPALTNATLRIFDKTNYMVSVYKLIEDLIDFDIENAIQFHKGGIDIYAISVLYDARTTNDYTEKQIDAMTSMITKLASIISSPTVVKHFVSLLCPTQKLAISKYQPKFLRCLYNLMTNVYNEHQLTFVFDPNKLITREINLKNKKCKEMSFVSWVSMHEIFEPKLLTSIYFPNSTIDIRICNEALIANCICSNVKTRLECEIDLYFDVWYIIIISLKVVDNKVFITGRINQNTFKIGSIDFNGDLAPFAVTIGNDDMEEGYSCEIAYAGLYDCFPISTFQTMINEGPLFIPETPTIASFVPETRKGDTFSDQDTTFAFALISLWKFDLIFPLFALFNFEFADHTCFSSAPMYSLAIMSRTLFSSDEGLRDFTDDNKIGYISYLLTMYNGDVLTYELYLQFYSLFQMAQLQELKDQIFKSIISNLNIWIVSRDQLLILKHWSQVCVNSYPKFTEIFTLTDFLYMLRIYYWFSPYDDPQLQGTPNSKRPRPQIDVAKCRLKISQIIVTLATLNPDSINLSYIIESCFASPEIQQIEGLLFLIELIIQKNCNVKVRTKDLYYLIKLNAEYRDEVVTIGVLKIFASLQMHKTLPNELLASFLATNINVLDSTILTKNFYESINTMFSSSIPELFPAISWYGINFQQTKTVGQCISKIVGLNGAEIEKFWYIWPAVFCAFSNEKECGKMILFMYSLIGDIRIICTIVDVVCTALGTESGNIKCSIFCTIADLILNDDNNHFSDTEKEHFIDYCLFFMLYRSFFDYSPAIEYQMRINGIIDTMYKECMGPPSLTSNSLFISISNIKTEKLRSSAGFRIDEVGRWDDCVLAKKIMEITNDNVIISYLLKITHHVLPDYEPVKKYKPVDLTMYQIEDLYKKVKNDNMPEFLNTCENIISFTKKVLDMQEKSVRGFHSEPRKEFNYLLNILDERKENHDRWIRLWSALSSDKGPWDAARAMPKKKQYMKRDNDNCYAFCPFRMRINHNYTKHEDANYKFVCKSGTVKLESPKRKRVTSNFFTQLPDETDSAAVLVNTKIGNRKSIVGGSKKEIISMPCKIIKIKGTKDGFFKFMKDRIEIFGKDGITSMYTLYHHEITYIYLRSRFHKLTAIEIFNSKIAPIFVDFEVNSMKILSKMYEYLPRKVQKLPFAQNFEKMNLMEDWANGNISNFCYLMLLNIMSGRSFNDLSQYPLFPWVVFDMDHSTLDFSNPATFRDFSKPIGAMNEENLKKILSTMNEQYSMMNDPPYMYSSGPVSRLVICLYLMRIEPFTSIHISLQGGHFDVPDRLVASVGETLKTIINLINDNRELVPEFFYMPEFLLNSNDFDLGMRNGKPLTDVETPPWAKNPMDFIYMHRKALESKYVSEHLKDWIDLIWGYKQRGEEAYKANNVYDSKLYENIWEEYAKQNRPTDGIADFMSMIGQIPPQLFTEPHKQRKNKTKYVLQHRNKVITEDKIIYAAYDLVEKHIIVVSEEGDVTTYLPIISQTIELQLVERQTFHNENYLKLFKSPEKLLFSSNEYGVIIITSELFQGAYIIHTGNNSQNLQLVETSQFRPIQLDCSCDWFIISGYDSTTSAYRISTMSQQYLTRSYRNNALCSCVSTTFKVQIIGVDDGSLIVSSLGTGQIIQIINLNAIPIRVAITPQWGFILVEMMNDDSGSMASHKLALYNINGMFIREQEISWTICNWCFWSSPRGFDYMAVITPKGALLYAEVYYLNMTNIASTDGVDPKSVSLKYLPQCGSIVVCSPSGEIDFIPYYDKEDW